MVIPGRFVGVGEKVRIMKRNLDFFRADSRKMENGGLVLKWYLGAREQGNHRGQKVGHLECLQTWFGKIGLLREVA